MTRVMIVDDEKLVLGTLRRMVALRLPEAEIRTADEPLAAREELLARPADILITDRNMPGLGGEELIREVRAARPETVCLLLTGDSACTPWISPDGCFASLGKPVNLAMLGESLAGAAEVLAAGADAATRRLLDRLARVIPPARGDLPHDGRTSGRRWIEAYGYTVGLAGEGLKTSASVMRLMTGDFVPALAIITGFVEKLAAVADAATVERHWRDTLARVAEARRAVAGAGAGESEQLTVQLREFVAGIGGMLGELFDTEPGPAGVALFARWGFTQRVLGAPAALPV